MGSHYFYKKAKRSERFKSLGGEWPLGQKIKQVWMKVRPSKGSASQSLTFAFFSDHWKNPVKKSIMDICTLEKLVDVVYSIVLREANLQCFGQMYLVVYVKRYLSFHGFIKYHTLYSLVVILCALIRMKYTMYVTFSQMLTLGSEIYTWIYTALA